MEKEYFTYLIIIGLILSFGLYVPTYFLLWLTPIYNKFKWPGRHLIIVNFALCVLAGMHPYAKYVIPIALIELFWYGKRFLYLRNESKMYPPKEVMEYFKTHKGRILILHDEFPVNATVPLGLVGITGYDPFILKSYHDLTNKLQGLEGYGQVTIKLNPNKEFLDELKVDYIYTDKEFEGFEVVLKTQKAMLLRRTKCIS